MFEFKTASFDPFSDGGWCLDTADNYGFAPWSESDFSVQGGLEFI